MTTNEVKTKLSAAGVKEASIAKLEREEMLEEVLLVRATSIDLHACGITMGEAMRVKEAFPPDIGPCQYCGGLTKGQCSGCNGYTHEKGFLCAECGRNRPCTFGNW